MTSVDDLLTELSETGWQISWLFQFAPDHWRCSLVCPAADPDSDSHLLKSCADAPTLASAIEDAMHAMAEKLEPSSVEWSIDISRPKLDLSTLTQKITIQRRF
jgi:hypothetical protein